MKKWLFAIVASFALASVAAPALADSDYTDPSGETPGSADIGAIHVSNSPTSGTITFTVNLANAPTLTDDTGIDLFLDTDQNSSTGAQPLGGAEFGFGLSAGGYDWEKWDTTANDFVRDTNPLHVTYNNGVMNVTIATSDIGSSVTALNFWLLTERGTDPSTAIIDSAPDSGPLYSYTMFQLAPTVTATSATFVGTPKAGKAFVAKSLSVDLSNGTTVKATGVKCTATLGGVVLKGTGAGGCTFKLPKTAKGKRLTIRVSGTWSNLPVARTTTFKVG